MATAPDDTTDLHSHLDDESDLRMTIRGRSLRFLLVAEMMHHAEVTVAELVTYLDELGFTIDGRPSKIISDALRWEVRRGRVVRLGRGRYRYRTAPPSTARRIRIFGLRCLAWLSAVSRDLVPPPLPPDPRPIPGDPTYPPTDPPWSTLRWLWVM